MKDKVSNVETQLQVNGDGLLPCPLCRSIDGPTYVGPNYIMETFVYCSNCRLHLKSCLDKNRKTVSAKDVWNKRDAPPLEYRVEIFGRQSVLIGWL